MRSTPSSADKTVPGTPAAKKRKRPSLPLRGGRACGAIRYHLDAMPLFLSACHCTDCQRHSGSAFSKGLPVPAAASQFERGQAKAWRFLGAAGIATRRCETCGGRIGGARDGSKRGKLRAGRLDDTSWLMPLAHDFMRSAQRAARDRQPQPWQRLAGGTACFATCRAKPRSYRW